MQAKVKRLLLLLLGWSFIVLGVIGLFVPVLQGVLFLLIGLFVLSSEYAWARRMLHHLRSHFPSLASRSDEGARKAHDLLARLFGRQPSAGREGSKESQAATHDSESKSNLLVHGQDLGARWREQASSHQALKGGREDRQSG